MQVLLWILLFALVSIRVGLPPLINIRILSINVGPPWSWDEPSAWLILAWIFSIALAIAGMGIPGDLPLVLPLLEIQRQDERRFFRAGQRDSGLVATVGGGRP